MATRKAKRREPMTDIPHRDFMRILQKFACDLAIEWVAQNKYTMRQAWLAVGDANWADTFMSVLGGEMLKRMEVAMYPSEYPE